MKLLICLLSITCVSLSSTMKLSGASITESSSSPQHRYTIHRSHVEALKFLMGRKLRVKEKVALWIVEHRRAPHYENDITPQQQRLGTLALIFGVTSLPLLLVPAGFFLAIPFAVLGIVLGAKSMRHNGNVPGVLGFAFGIATLFVVLLALVVAIVWLT